MNNMGLLSDEQIFGDSRLNIFRKYGPNAVITDFAILLGGYVSNYHIGKGRNFKDRAGFYLTKTEDSESYVCSVNETGCSTFDVGYLRYAGTRVTLPYSLTLNNPLSRLVKSSKNPEEVFVEYGEYPQSIVNKSTSKMLEKLYSDGKLNKTGKLYTTDSVDYNSFEVPFKERTHTEYIYDGKKYIRFIGDYNSKGQILSDKRKVKEGKPYWVKVEPIYWLIDVENDILVSTNLLFSGVQLCDEIFYYGNFNKSRMKWFLDTYFEKDIMPSKIKTKQETKEINKEINKEIIKEEPKVILNTNEEKVNEIVPYLVKYEDSNEKYGAYEISGILRDIITSFKIVSETKEDALEYASKEKTSFEVLSSYYIKDMNQEEKLEYVKKICELGKNNKLYDMYLEELERKISKEKVENLIRSLHKNKY